MVYLGVRQMMPKNVKDAMKAWYCEVMGKRQRKAQRVAPFCSFWTILKQRNRIVLYNKALAVQRWKGI